MNCKTCGKHDAVVFDGECIDCAPPPFPREKTNKNPGSEEARKNGCTCPIMDNAHGRGYMGGAKDENGNVLYVITQGCPLHDKLPGCPHWDSDEMECAD